MLLSRLTLWLTGRGRGGGLNSINGQNLSGDLLDVCPVAVLSGKLCDGVEPLTHAGG